MASKSKTDDERVETKEIEESDDRIKTVTGLAEAETLQKAGWQLISVRRTSKDPFSEKEYKFRKE